MYFRHSCWIWNNGGEDKNIPNNRGASKNYTEKIKITVALLYINYEPSLI